MKGLDVDNISQTDSFLQLIDRLGELEVVIGERAKPVVAEVRTRLREAASARERGDVPGALAIIGQAMERLAGLASHLDAAEGALMHAIAGSFAQALSAGDRGTAKQAVDVMRNKAGDRPKDTDSDSDW
ncbi:MAG: hypothetical protein ACLQU2_37780 [Candidatus Binataceae bacterium]